MGLGVSIGGFGSSWWLGMSVRSEHEGGAAATYKRAARATRRCARTSRMHLRAARHSYPSRPSSSRRWAAGPSRLGHSQSQGRATAQRDRSSAELVATAPAIAPERRLSARSGRCDASRSRLAASSPIASRTSPLHRHPHTKVKGRPAHLPDNKRNKPKAPSPPPTDQHTTLQPIAKPITSPSTTTNPQLAPT